VTDTDYRIEAGVYELTDDEYFNGPLARASLSSTGVRDILSSPARFRYRQQHGRPDTRAFDVGHAAHQLVLGAGPELVRIDADEWRSNAVKAEVAAVRAEGKVPLKPADWRTVFAMADALQAHPHAPKLITRGEPEKTLLWRNQGLTCRAKVDWLRADGIVDYKTCDRADLDSLTRSVWNYGYAIQAAWYLQGFRLLDLDALTRQEPFFAFVAQEKEPPYLVQCFQLTERALTYGDRKCAEALDIYRECLKTDEWPGYATDDIPEIDLPSWVRTEEF
jgi:hypothetical protein